MSRALFAKLTDLRDRVLDRVRKVNERTEQGALGAGAHLAKVVETARGHIEHLRGLLSKTNDGGLQAAIAAQAEHVREHGAGLDEAVAQHASEVANLARTASQISSAAREIERANAAAHILALNARIESSRSEATVFKAIAIEMTALSRDIVAANTRIQELTSALETTVPRLVADATTLRSTVSSFTREARAQIDHVDREVAQLKTSVAGALRSSDGALASIIESSHAGLSALQFQDVCAQSLLQIDLWNAEVLRTVDDGRTMEITPILDAISTDDAILDSASPGDVLLF